MNRIYFTVTNDLSYDQRMNRICSSLANAGYAVILVGRKLPGSIPLVKKNINKKDCTVFLIKGDYFMQNTISVYFFIYYLKRWMRFVV